MSEMLTVHHLCTLSFLGPFPGGLQNDRYTVGWECGEEESVELR